jgi:serine/threonine protein kinase
METEAVFQGSARLGPYTLLRRLRDVQSGFAYVGAKAGPSGFEKRVVIHCTTRERLDRVVEEATRAARLCHAGIAHVLDAGALEDTSFVAFEHVEGTTLHALLLRHGTLPWETAAAILVDTARALAYAHGRRGDDGRLLGIVHRRISPRRITVAAAGLARLTGLGASWAWPDAGELRPPEETRGEPIDGRADVFALGLILRRCLRGATAPPSLQRIIGRATHSLPEQRHTAAELRDELTALLQQAGRSTAPSASTTWMAARRA